MSKSHRPRVARVRLVAEALEDRLTPSAPFPEFVDPNPSAGNRFGDTVVSLSTGNVVVTAPLDDFAATDAGAVYLFNGATGALISTFRGSTANDQVGGGGAGVGGGVTALANGNYVVRSLRWDNGAVVDAGATTFGNGTTGVSGTVSAANSLVGTAANDGVAADGTGSIAVTALASGNYVVTTPRWNNGMVVDAGAVTFGSGTTGISGAISAANSLVGTTANDGIDTSGFNLSEVTALPSGNYVVRNSLWDNGAASNAGAVTFGNGTTGVSGVISAANSLVGTSANDSTVNSVTVLTNGNYVVANPYWDNGAASAAGAVTFGSGTTGVSGAISTANSLVGTTANDFVGNVGVTALTNGNYVVCSAVWRNGAVSGAGAATFGNGTTGISGPVSAANSLVGSANLNSVGSHGATALTNGNYVVGSPMWDNGAATNAGAATFGNGTTGVSGPVSAANSLVGTTAGDNVGSGGATALTNGNYVVTIPSWNNGAVQDVGAVTFGNGTTGVSGAISAANSLVGTSPSDAVGGGGLGSGGVAALTNGNYVVRSPSWNNGAVVDVGAVTFGNGTTGVTGPVSAANSLVGTTAGDGINLGGSGSIRVEALTNGNYVVTIPTWDNGAVADAGAATFGSGATGVSGPISAANSLVGTTTSDEVGSGGVEALTNGGYVVTSPRWDNGAVADAGAATFGNGTTGVSGPVSAANSLVGTSPGDKVGDTGTTALTNGNYVVSSLNWSGYAGAATFGSGTTGVSGPLSAANSLVGVTGFDPIGGFSFVVVTALPNGNYVVSSPGYDDGGKVNAGAVTFGNGTVGVSGPIPTPNTTVGPNAQSGLQFLVADAVNGTFFARFLSEGRVRAGSQGDGFVASRTLPSVTLSVSASAGTEAGSTVITVTATATSTVSGDATVALAVTGTDITAGDFTLSNATITIPNGQTSSSVTFTVVNDALVEGPETATLTISNPSANITLGATTSQAIGISSDDVSPPATAATRLVVGGTADGMASAFTPDSAGAFGAATGLPAVFGSIAANVRTAAADVDGDGIDDAVMVTGPGTPLRVAVVSGADHATVLVASFDPFGGDFTGGGFVAAADLDGDGRAEFVVTPDEGGGPRVSVFSRNTDGTTTVRANFLGIDDTNFRGGARAAVGDVNNDGVPDLIVCAGFGGGPRTAIFNGTTVFGTPTRLVNDFFAFPGTDATNLRNGVFVASGDVTGDGFADLVFGGGPGGAPRVFILDGALVSAGNVDAAQATPVANFFVAGNADDRGGVRLATTNADGDSRADVIAGSGAGSPARARVYLGANMTGGGEPAGFQDIDLFGGGNLPGGVFVG